MKTEQKAMNRHRIIIFSVLFLFSILFVGILQKTRGINDFLSVTDNNKILVSLWYILFTMLLLSLAILRSDSIKSKVKIFFSPLFNHEKIYIFLAFIVYIFWALAFSSGFYGPDEYMRQDIPNFIFQKGYLPCGWEEEIRNPIWGVSYGFEISLAYLSSAYLMSLMSLFTSSDYMLLFASRMTSVLSMAGVAYFSILISKKVFHNNPIRWFFIVSVTLLPQLVFLGSYVNLDSFSLFVSFMIVYGWIRCIEEKWSVRTCVFLSVGLGICFLSYKFAYGYILATFLLYCVWSLIHRKEYSFKVFILHGLLILGITFFICGWSFIRNAVLYNGDFLSLNSSAPYAELFAQEPYKPSAKSSYARNGVSIPSMLKATPWFEGSLKSLIGVFGYLSIFLKEWIYSAYFWLFGLGMAFFIMFFIKMKKADEYLVIIVMAVSAVITLSISIYYSWSWDYQAQGRYIVTILPFVCTAATLGYEWIIHLIFKKKLKTGNKPQREFALVSSLFIIFSMVSGYVACLKAF